MKQEKQETLSQPIAPLAAAPQVNGKTEIASDLMLLTDSEKQGLMVVVNNITNCKVALFDLETRRSQLQQEMDLANRAFAGVLFGYGRARGIDRDLSVTPDLSRLIFKEQ